MVLYFNFQRLNKSIFFKCYKLRSQFNPLSAKKHLYVHLFKFVIFSSRFEKEIAGNLPPPPKMPEMMNPPNFMGGPPSMPGPPPFMNRQGDGGSQQRMAFPGPPPQMPSNMFGPPRMDGMQRPPGMPPGMPAPPPMMVPPPMMPMPPMGMQSEQSLVEFILYYEFTFKEFTFFKFNLFKNPIHTKKDFAFLFFFTFSVLFALIL